MRSTRLTLGEGWLTEHTTTAWSQLATAGLASWFRLGRTSSSTPVASSPASDTITSSPTMTPSARFLTFPLARHWMGSRPSPGSAQQSPLRS